MGGFSIVGCLDIWKWFGAASWNPGLFNTFWNLIFLILKLELHIAFDIRCIHFGWIRPETNISWTTESPLFPESWKSWEIECSRRDLSYETNSEPETKPFTVSLSSNFMGSQIFLWSDWRHKRDITPPYVKVCITFTSCRLLSKIVPLNKVSLEENKKWTVRSIYDLYFRNDGP